MKTVKFINGENLRIARDNIGFSTIIVSRKISKSKKDLVFDWESGRSLPTWPQVKKLSKLYGVPELSFFSKDLIERDKAIPDYRVGSREVGAGSVKRLINLVIKRQRWLEQKFRDDGANGNNLQGSGRKIDDPEELARFIKDKLNIRSEDIKAISGNRASEKVLDFLIEKAEDRQIFIGKTISYHKIDVNEMRGLFVSNKYCPFIVLNRKDAIHAQIFSLIHELAHLFRKTDAISNSLEFRNGINNLNPEEIFCNKVAAEFLLPRNDFQKAFYNKRDIDEISNIYKVSKISVFYRLKDLGTIKKETANNLEGEIKSEMAENLRRRDESRKGQKGGNYVNNMKDSNGDLFNRMVSNAYLQDRIGYVEASNLLKFSAEEYA